MRVTICIPRRRAARATRSRAPRAGGRRTRRPSGRRRTLVRLGIVALVVAIAALLHMHVSLTRRFEGRLWMLPSRIYSDVLVLAPGDPIDPSALVRRLDRSGYARTETPPRRPGQYHRDGPDLDVFLRAFEATGYRQDARRLLLRFRDRRLRTVRDPDGRAAGRMVLEPELLATLFGPRHEERRPIRLARIPAPLRDAVLAAEDARFYEHLGLDLRGIVRASWANVRRGRIVQGGSTITQQTVKNIFLDSRRTWWRKAREGVLSVLLDAAYSKERILEVYLNEVYLGQRGPVAICGVQSAARFYFGRDVADLSLAESALLAGLIRSPGRYNPFLHRERALERRAGVLRAMARLGRITGAEAEAAQGEPLVLARGGGGLDRAPYAVDFVKSRLAELFSPETLRWEGLRVYTTLDSMWQEEAESALREGLARLERDGRRKRGTPLQGAVLVLEPESGALRAMVGGRDYAASQFNRAVQARRQPGSCFKPFVFAAGFENELLDRQGGITPATLLDDSPLEMASGGGIWRPANYDGRHRGWVTVRAALEQSLNVPTVRAALRVGIDRVVATARAAGIASPLKPLPSLALGTSEVTPLELASGYATLARLGRAGRPWVIREIVDDAGEPLLRPRVAWTRAMRPQSAYLVNHLLRGVIQRGTARSAVALGYRGDAAGKTGTTDDTRDAWFVGYSRDLLALVWVGYDDGAPTGLTGATGALPIWVDLMRRAGRAADHVSDAVPEGIVAVRIDPESGGRARRGCPHWIEERFAAGSAPRHDCPLHGGRFRHWLDRFRRPRSDVARDGV